ncbi:hypothetical protein C5C00_01575 [Rathayibacter rathayi]|uniref:DEAD/DEAH box helicase n=1 Tax=Rathayibacter rathayi TaxID=33887 RepID=UPI000CE7D26B|nr:DEAD/DEAH box helicase [Rathayibacter rathayi]PPG90692.1 hypothetical protein C5C47_00845 [Rathayibacter rathayi]PPG98739.1 hypothetical protein C5C00_01575 [Rathayibacter rathayi]
MTETLATSLGRHILSLDGFQSQFAELEELYATAFLFHGQIANHYATSAGQKELLTLLRYADILSQSEDGTHREAAYNIISLLRELSVAGVLVPEQAGQLNSVAEAVMVELGNFPGLATLHTTSGELVLPLEREVTRETKALIQQTEYSNSIFTDAQYRIAQAMKQKDFFSFSGPTSLGKSFIIKDALAGLVSRTDMDNSAIVLLVPTKALIGQAAADLRTLFANISGVNVATYPTLPVYLRRKFSRTVFVFTPERFLSYLARPVREVRYVFVDEAQKVIAQNDARSSLYYHAISEATRLFATKLIFASPNIENPEIFLRLFQRSTVGALAVTDRTVSQQRFLVDLVEGRTWFYRMFAQEPYEVPGVKLGSAEEIILNLSGDTKSIVYVNSSSRAASLVLQFAKNLPIVKDQRIDRLIAFAESYIHRDYFLIECLRHGVAYHHGKMPQEVRERVEACFAERSSSLKFIFCTSTLLEGVNLPAKNIFVLEDRSGLHNLNRIDFENLIGRAGRLRYDFSGNVICIRDTDKKWNRATRALIGERQPHRATSFIVELPGKRKKEYTDIAHMLRGTPIPGDPSAETIRSIQQYASIMTLQQLDKSSSPLRDNFIEKVPDGRELLRKAGAEVEVSLEMLRKVPDIRPEYQNRALREVLEGGEGAALISLDADFSDVKTFHNALSRLYRVYRWDIEESRGRDPLVHKKSVQNDTVSQRLWYWARLMRNWVRGDPLSRVVGEAIGHHREVGTITFMDYERSNQPIIERFNPQSGTHINIVIEDVFKALEHGLRFRILRYVQNYSDIYRSARGAESDSVVNFAALLEYGTMDSKVVELQDVGFSRTTALALASGYAEYLIFDRDGALLEINSVPLLGLLSDEVVREEILNITQLSA